MRPNRFRSLVFIDERPIEAADHAYGILPGCQQGERVVQGEKAHPLVSHPTYQGGLARLPRAGQQHDRRVRHRFHDTGLDPSRVELRCVAHQDRG